MSFEIFYSKNQIKIVLFNLYMTFLDHIFQFEDKTLIAKFLKP